MRACGVDRATGVKTGEMSRNSWVQGGSPPEEVQVGNQKAGEYPALQTLREYACASEVAKPLECAVSRRFRLALGRRCNPATTTAGEYPALQTLRAVRLRFDRDV
jgi:hypothetical protein